jgi:hypothetical protein
MKTRVRTRSADPGTLSGTNLRETLNQLVEGSSPSRLTGNVKAPRKESRAKWRGSFCTQRDFAGE